MKYEEGKTYTLTGNETHYRGRTLREYYANATRDFPVEAVYEGVDFEGDLQFRALGGWALYVKGTGTETNFDVVNHPPHYNGQSAASLGVDTVNHPAHYNSHPKNIEAIDVIEDNPFVNLGNAMKYLWRVSWGSKGHDDEDLAKAVWYIERERSRRAKEN